MQANAPAVHPQDTLEIPADWTFASSDVAKTFDAHVREQLPWYDLATGLVAHVVRHYLPHGGLMFDIGASTGNIGRALWETVKAREVRFVAIESSEQMAAAYTGPGECIVADAAEYAFPAFDVAVAFLSLSFVPVASRGGLIAALKARVCPGGALVIVDKFEAPAGYLGTVLHRLTIAGKVATGTPSADVIAKELSLSGVQRPLTSAPGDEVFRVGEFAGYVWTPA